LLCHSEILDYLFGLITWRRNPNFVNFGMDRARLFIRRCFPHRPPHHHSTCLLRFRMAAPLDCDRSSLLNYEFPLPRYYLGHTTGSTNSTWAQQWTTLHYWTPNDVAYAFRQYWDLTVTANDKHQPITWRTFIDGTIAMMNGQQPKKLTSSKFLIGAYPRLIVLQYHATRTGCPRVIFILQFSCGKTSFLENLIIFFKTQLHIKSPASAKRSHRGTLVLRRLTMSFRV
jgi:hypothetical protein